MDTLCQGLSQEKDISLRYMAFAKSFHFVILWVAIGIEKGVEIMTDLQVGKIYQGQPISVDLVNVRLYQDHYIEILNIDKGKVTYRYS